MSCVCLSVCVCVHAHYQVCMWRFTQGNSNIQSHWAVLNIRFLVRRFLVIAHFHGSVLGLLFFRNLWGVMCGWNSPMRMLLWLPDEKYLIQSFTLESCQFRQVECLIGCVALIVRAQIYANTTKTWLGREKLRTALSRTAHSASRIKNPASPASVPRLNQLSSPRGWG